MGLSFGDCDFEWGSDVEMYRYSCHMRLRLNIASEAFVDVYSHLPATTGESALCCFMTLVDDNMFS
jgi:hypothetical protein